MAIEQSPGRREALYYGWSGNDQSALETNHFFPAGVTAHTPGVLSRTKYAHEGATDGLARSARC